MEDFVFYGESDALPNTSDIHLLKRGYVYDVRVFNSLDTGSGKANHRMSFATGPVRIVRTFEKNSFKGKEGGTLSVSVNGRLSEVVSLIEGKAKEAFVNTINKGKLITANFFDKALSSCIYGDTAKLNMASTSATIFDCEGKLLQPVCLESIPEDQEVNLVIEPCHCYFMDKPNEPVRTGIRWEIRQMKLLTDVPYHIVFLDTSSPPVLVSLDLDEAALTDAKKTPAPKRKMPSLLRVYSDEEDD